MRKTLASMIVLGAGLSVAAVGLAQAQDANTASPTAAPMAAPMAPMAPMAAPMAPAAPMGAPMAPAAPMAPDQASPAPAPAPPPMAAAAPPPPEAPMVMPTSGNGLALLDLIGKVCDPLMSNPKAKLDTVAKAAGGFEKLRANKTDLPYGGWKGGFGSGGTATIVGQSEVNQKVCEIVLDTKKDDAQVLADAIIPWSNLHKPFMRLSRNDAVSVGSASLRRFTWFGADDAQTYALNMNVESNPDGSSPNPGGDRIRVRYTIAKR